MALFSSNNDKKSRERRESEDRLSRQFSANNDENVNGISTISMETTITGTIESNSVFKMEGVLNGDIKGNKLVHVGKTGQVKGNITAETVVVDGEVSGEIIADKVEIGGTGKVYATITSAVFVIQEGGIFEGRKKIKIALIKEEDAKAKKEKEEKKPKEPEIKANENKENDLDLENQSSFGKESLKEDETKIIIERRIFRDGDNLERIIDERGQYAKTAIKVLKTYPEKNATLVECELFTGRTHQIRVHLKSIGHTIVGDELYGNGLNKELGINRQFLHAYKVKFIHPASKKEVELEIPIFSDMKEFLEK